MCGRDVNQGWLALVWQIAEGIERFAIFPHIEQNATANRPEPRGRKGNTCQQLVDCIETLLEPSAIAQPIRLVPLDLRVHRIECDGPLGNDYPLACAPCSKEGPLHSPNARSRRWCRAKALVRPHCAPVPAWRDRH